MIILTWRQVCCELGVFTRSVRNDVTAVIKSAVTELCCGVRGLVQRGQWGWGRSSHCWALVAPSGLLAA